MEFQKSILDLIKVCGTREIYDGIIDSLEKFEKGRSLGYHLIDTEEATLSLMKLAISFGSSYNVINNLKYGVVTEKTFNFAKQRPDIVDRALTLIVNAKDYLKNNEQATLGMVDICCQPNSEKNHLAALLFYGKVTESVLDAVVSRAPAEVLSEVFSMSKDSKEKWPFTEEHILQAMYKGLKSKNNTLVLRAWFYGGVQTEKTFSALCDSLPADNEYLIMIMAQQRKQQGLG